MGCAPPVESRPMRHLHSSILLGALLLGRSADAQQGAPKGEWHHYGGDLGSTRYSPLDQIDRTNAGKLEIAWRWEARNLGPRPDFNFRATPIMVGGTLYTTAGSRRSAVAIDARTGETLWIYRFDEGDRGKDGATADLGTGRFLLDRRKGGENHLPHAGVLHGGARRFDRPSVPRLRPRRRRRSEGRSRSPRRSGEGCDRLELPRNHRGRRHRGGRRPSGGRTTADEGDARSPRSRLRRSHREETLDLPHHPRAG